MYQRCHCKLRPERFLKVMSLQDFFENLILSPCTCTHDANRCISTLSSYNVDKDMILDDYFLQTESLSVSVAGFSVVWCDIEENYTEKII